jgi:4-diphosphocytidyl-2-C-methyl-D-erythritol kinase
VNGSAAEPPSISRRCPAKLNLSLAVLERRTDGFHAIESLIVPIDLADTLTVQTGGVPGIRLTVRCEGPRASHLAADVPTGATNLVVRAAAAIAKEAGIEPALDIELVKRVPSRAGLGGGSSNAAAMLLAALEAWGLVWPRERVMAIAATLGSDVPWFLEGVPAVVTGRGEKITPVAALPSLFAVVVAPASGLSTAAVYGACTPDPSRAGDAFRLAEALARGDLTAAMPLMHNALEPAARKLSGEIDCLLADIAQSGGITPRLTGSGSACFTLCRTLGEAKHIAARLSALQDAGIPRWPAVFTVASAPSPSGRGLG